MNRISDKFVIASIAEANEHLGLNAVVENKLVLFEYSKNVVWKRMEWMPIIDVHEERQENSTHTVNGYFVSIPDRMLPNTPEHFISLGLDVVEL